MLRFDRAAISFICLAMALSVCPDRCLRGVFAQDNDQGENWQPYRGTFQKFDNGIIYVESPNGMLEMRLIKPGGEWTGLADTNVKETIIDIVGVLDYAAIEKGMYVQFQADIRRRRTISNPVKQVDVFTPRGLIPSGFTNNGRPRMRKKDDPDDESLMIFGKVLSTAKDSFNVDVADPQVRRKSRRITVPVSDQTLFRLDVNDIGMARTGDRVLARMEDREGNLYVRHVQITRGDVDVADAMAQQINRPDSQSADDPPNPDRGKKTGGSLNRKKNPRPESGNAAAERKGRWFKIN